MLDNSIDPIVSKGILNETRELNIQQRKNKKISKIDKFFEKTSTLGVAAVEIPLWLVKEFSLARLNSYALLLIFGSSFTWSALKIKDNLNNFLNLVFPIVIAVFSAYKMIQAIMQLSLVYNDIKKIKNAKNNNYDNVPIFVKKVYRSLIIKRVDINWFSFIYYISAGIYILIPQLLQGKTIPYTIITFEFANIDQPWGVYNVVKYSILVLLLFQLFYLLWTKNRINVIDTFYQYEVVPNLEQIEIKKTRHARWRRVLVVFILTILIVPILISRLLKNRGMIK